MYALILTSLIYLSHFAPWVISRPFLVLPILSVLALAASRRADRALMIVIVASLFVSFSSSLSVSLVSYGFPSSSVKAIYGRVVQDSAQKTGRMSGYRLSLSAAEDGKGSVTTARGSIYVLSEQSDLFSGDEVRVSGYVSGDIFIGTTMLLHRPWSADARRAMILWVRDRLRSGNAGELSMRLLLGAGEDGVYGLAEDARLSGLSHVLALSGMHLTILASVLSLPLSLLPWKRGRRVVIDSFLLFFSFLSGWRPSLVRAFIFRLLLERRIRLDEAFALSALALFSAFPEAVVDLGAEYSFISLGAIFLLSVPFDRGIRSILPIPPSLSASAAASLSALLFSIPLTLSVFGAYQLGAIITSLPVTLMISLYMGLSLAVLAIPPLLPILDLPYAILQWLFSASASFPMLSGWTGYAVLVVSSIVLLSSGLLSSRHVEPELQQHKRDHGGSFLP